MKNSKKFLAGLCMLLGVVAAFFAISGKALAGVAPGDIHGATYTFQDGSNIIGDFGGSGKVAFTDVDETDPTPNYIPDSAAFCDPGDMPDQNGISGKIRFGINLQSTDKSMPNIPAQIKLGYYTGANVCNGVLISKNIANPNGAAKTDFQWDGNTITGLSGANQDVAFTPAPNQTKVTLYLDNPSDGCADGAILLDQEGGNTGRYYTLSPIEGAFPPLSQNLDDYPAIKGYFIKSKCHVDSLNTINIAGQAGTAAPTSGTTCQPNDKSCAPTKSCEANFNTAFEWLLCPALKMADSVAGAFNDFIEGQLFFCTGTSSTTGERCSDNNLTEQVHKAWAIFRTLASVILVIVLLIMVISQAAGWGGLDAYTIRKMLPRLVIAVLFIQISWVMFKWFIDLSNDLGHGIQDLLFAPFGGSNNISLDKLMGSGIHTATGSHAGSDAFAFFAVIAALGVAWVSLPAIFSLAIIVIFALLTAFLTLVFRKVLIITLVLLSPIALVAWIVPGTEKYWKMWLSNFQRVLLMFPMIMALIAGGRILAYVTSGGSTAIMPHMAVAHIGHLPVPYFSSVNGFAQLAIIVVAYFGPYFLLPKTYSWGGEFMKIAGDRIKGGLDKMSEKPKEYAKNRGDNWREERRRNAKERVSEGIGFSKNPVSWLRTPMDRFRSGQWDPSYGRPGSRRRYRAVAGYKESGEKSYQEDKGAAKTSVRREWEQLEEGKAHALDKDGNKIKNADGSFREVGVTKDDYLQDMWYNRKTKDYKTHDGRDLDPRSRHPLEKVAALEEMSTLGGATNFRHIMAIHKDMMKNGTQEQKAAIAKFKNDNVQLLLPKLTDMYKGVGSTADSGPEGISGHHGVEVENMFGELSARIKGAEGIMNDGTKSQAERDTASKNRQDAIKQLNSYARDYLSAAENPNLRGRMEKGGTRAVKAFVTEDDNLRDQLLYDPEAGINAMEEDGREIIIGMDGKSKPLAPIDSTPQLRELLDARVRQRLDAIINNDTSGGFDDVALSTRPAAAATTRASARSSGEEEPPTGGAPVRPMGPGPQPSSGGTGYAPGFNTGAAGNVVYSRPQSGSFGPANIGPTVIKIDHEAAAEIGRNIARNINPMLDKKFDQISVDHRSGGDETIQGQEASPQNQSSNQKADESTNENFGPRGQHPPPDIPPPNSNG